MSCESKRHTHSPTRYLERVGSEAKTLADCLLEKKGVGFIQCDCALARDSPYYWFCWLQSNLSGGIFQTVTNSYSMDSKQGHLTTMCGNLLHPSEMAFLVLQLLELLWMCYIVKMCKYSTDAVHYIAMVLMPAFSNTTNDDQWGRSIDKPSSFIKFNVVSNTFDTFYCVHSTRNRPSFDLFWAVCCVNGPRM